MDPKKYTVPDADFTASSDPNTDPVFSLPTLSQLEAMLKAQLEQDKAEEEAKAQAPAPVHSDSPGFARGEDTWPKSAPVPDLPTVEQLVRLQEENVPIRDPATERRSAAPFAGARLSRHAPAKASVRVRPVRRAAVKVVPKQNKTDVQKPQKARHTDTARTADAVSPTEAPKTQPKDGLPTLAQLEAFLRSEKSAEEFSSRRPQSSAAVAARFRPEPREDVIPELVSREDRFSSGLPTLSQLTDLLREEPKEPREAPTREPAPARPAEPKRPEKQGLPTADQLAALLEQERAYGNTAFQENVRRARENAAVQEPEEKEPVNKKEKVCYIPYETFAAAYHPDFSDTEPEAKEKAASASVFEEIPEPESLRPEEFDFTEEPDEGKRRGGKKRSADAHGSDAVRRYNTTMTVKLTVPPSWTSSLRKSS